MAVITYVGGFSNKHMHIEATVRMKVGPNMQSAYSMFWHLAARSPVVHSHLM